MSTLTVTLNNNYKSFSKGFNFEFNGNLIILSGVNGSGKSHLIDVIHGQIGNSIKHPLNNTIVLDEVSLSASDVIYRSFKENVSIPELTASKIDTQINSRNQAWVHYSKSSLDYKHPECIKFSRSCIQAKKILIDEFGEEQFNKKAISEKEVKDAMPNEFIWRSDDLFANFIGEIFFNYAYVVSQKEQEAGKKGVKFDPSTLSTPPWVDLNNLFKELKLDYRFKENYELNGFEINEQPQLYPLTEDGVINEGTPRQLSDLSDGEKAIISFAFASLSGVQKEEKKILLLDEYDATLNPSLIEMFFKILDKYFISKGIPVILATHSTATIALAPEYTSFYEVFKEKKDHPRILEINREQYKDLQKVHKQFYKEIESREVYIKKIQEENEALKKNIEELNTKRSTSGPPLIITEGKTDWKHLKKALERLEEFKDLEVEFHEYTSDMGDKELLKICKTFSRIVQPRTIICVFDRDNPEITKEHEGQEYKDWGGNVISFCLPALSSRDFDEISIEHYYMDANIKTTDKNGRRLFLGEEFLLNGNGKDKQFEIPWSRKKEKENAIIDSDVYDRNEDIKHETSVALPKSHFADYIYIGEPGFDNFNVENFKLIFEVIRKIVNITSPPTELAQEPVFTPPTNPTPL